MANHYSTCSAPYGGWCSCGSINQQMHANQLQQQYSHLLGQALQNMNIQATSASPKKLNKKLLLLRK